MYNNIPKSFIAGESISWKLFNNDYSPSEGWDLSYSFKSKDGGIDEIACNPNEDHFIVEISKETSEQFAAGCYWWQLTAKREPELRVIDNGTIDVESNLSALDQYDGRSHAEKVLDALEACLLGKAKSDQLSYSIAGRSLSRMGPAELLKWRQQYQAEVIMQKRKHGILKDQNIKVRF